MVKVATQGAIHDKEGTITVKHSIVQASAIIDSTTIGILDHSCNTKSFLNGDSHTEEGGSCDWTSTKDSSEGSGGLQATANQHSDEGKCAHSQRFERIQAVLQYFDEIFEL